MMFMHNNLHNDKFLVKLLLDFKDLPNISYLSTFNKNFSTYSFMNRVFYKKNWKYLKKITNDRKNKLCSHLVLNIESTDTYTSDY